MKRTLSLCLLSLSLLLPVGAWAQTPASAPVLPAQTVPALTPEQVEEQEAQAEMDRAIQRIKDIVNQPITHVPQTTWSMPPVAMREGWFHPGATRPDFNTVDVRKTQEFPYAKYDRVSSPLNPHEMFIGAELEFNSATKYFYTDRNIPKKKLTEAEMLEINRLYRIIGEDEKQLADIKKERETFHPARLVNSGYGTLLQLVLLVAIFFFAYKKWFADKYR